ncbi:Borealin N terminal-domain-containing protein [Amylocarpus encephaloides]|uniref:Borealin N terminal-domain-containing protein n=1 Tax=Amylocarpus encephaloides TaxID=45428 RepID=A0A9P7YFI1_9HELO|nr:Borealin N terminal-domain-containing protein [Amylocarpus encephaloides]
MAPTRTKKRKSTESTTSSVDMQSFPAPPQMVPTKTRNPVRSPSNRSPIKKSKPGITMAQKQRLIENLQLEITERARKLRAQYALQAQGLRTRVEIRVNRIPTALRRAKMGDLFTKHNNATMKNDVASNNAHKNQQRIEKANTPSKARMEDAWEQNRASPSPQKPKKRPSEDISVDQENEDIENPKKRVRANPAPPVQAASRERVNPSHVLSPRSANSRTIARSPVRPGSPAKIMGRPVSPLKPMAPVPAGSASGILTNMVEKAKASRGAIAARKVAETRKVTETKAPPTGAGRGRRTAAAAQPAAPRPATRTGRGRAGTISDSSETSNMTVVRKPVPPKKEPAKRTVMGTLRGMGTAPNRKAPAPKVAAPATGGRVLRKRN